MASQTFQPIHFPDIKDKIDGKTPLLGALFLFCTFFFTFFFLYFIYLCTHRRGGASNAPPPRATGLDPAAISSLPVSSYAASIGGKKPSPAGECAICLSVFQDGDGVKVLPLCRHGFHSDCVDRWLTTHSSCPLCRACVDSLSRHGVP